MSTALEQRTVITESQTETKQATQPASEIYSDLSARKVLQFMLRSPRTPITPEILPTDEMHYPQLAAVIDANAAGTLELLTRMVKARVLLADLADKAPACPDCGSHQVSTRYTCPKCFSYDISRSFLFEHLKCGQVANDDTFRKGDQLVCPKCQAVLHNFGVEYRAVGAWYRCSNCNESFNPPSSSHFCRPRRHQFSLDRTRLIPIYQYRLNPATLADTRKEILMYNDAISMLEALGLIVQAPDEVIGRSGEHQYFDIGTSIKGGRWGGSKTVAIDVNTSTQNLTSEHVREFAAKAKDSRVNETYLIAVPGLNEEAKTVAKNLKVTVIEGASVKEAMTTLLNRDPFKALTP